MVGEVCGVVGEEETLVIDGHERGNGRGQRQRRELGMDFG